MHYCLLLIVTVLIGCSSGYRASPIDPPVDVLEFTVDDAMYDPLIQLTDYMPEDWWNLFNDTQLALFIETALTKNPTLQKAQANILLAIYSADQIRSSLFPYITWGADVAREKLSKTGLVGTIANGSMSNTTSTPNVPSFPVAGASTIPFYFTQWETEFTLTYEFDFWGKNRNALRAALGEVQAQIADQAFSRLQLAIAVARVYFRLQIDYKRQEIARQQMQIRSKFLELTRLREKSHLDNEQKVNNAEIDFDVAKQALLQVKADIAVNEYQLKAYLAGSFDEVIYDTCVIEQPLPKVPFPEDVPLHLIGHRPDIISQLWIIESAGRQIEVAKAGFYPDFNLMAFFGFQSLQLSKLFQWRSTYWIADPAVTLPIFDAGRLTANLRESEISYDLAILEYNNRILNAAKEVLDGLAVLRNIELQLKESRKILSTQQKNESLTNLLVVHNLDSGLSQLNSESNVLIAKDKEIEMLGETFQAILSLIKALGGGYTACYEET